MTKNRTGNNKFLKKFNQTVILDLIRINKEISRAELSKLTGLSPTATGGIVSELMDKGYITKKGVGVSKGGRRPVMLELKPRSFYSIGVDMDINYLSFILMDTTNEVIEERLLKMPKPAVFEEVIKIAGKEIKKIIDNHNIQTDRLLGVGMSIPGMIDTRKEKIILAPNLEWENKEIKIPFEEFPDISVYAENEAMASAIGENWIGTCKGINNFVCINIKSGIGSGIFIEGKPYRGAGGSTGEVGHIVVDDNGIKCGCGNYGCLETISSTTRIVEKAKKLVKQGIVSKLNDVKDIEEIDIDTIIVAAKDGDEVSKNILIESARYLGLAISSIVNILNPEKIVIGKEFVNYADLVMSQLQKIVDCRALKRPAQDVEITKSQLGEKASVLGAAIIPVKVLFGR